MNLKNQKALHEEHEEGTKVTKKAKKANKSFLPQMNADEKPEKLEP